MTEFPYELANCTGFQWDAGNADKNWEQHGVTQGETEEVFFNRPVQVASAKRTRQENRYAALGQTTGGRLLTVVFTIRGTLIWPISVRDMSRRERRIYERQKES
ncbi:MAG: BrnT family toxin [Gemmatimonadota bacterium]